MKLLSHDEEGAVIHVSWDEMAIMHYAIAEVVQKIDAWEFPILVGAPVEVAKALSDQLGEVLKREQSEKNS